jgi:integrase
MSITLYKDEIVEGEIVAENNLIKEAIRGLLAEIDPLSQKKYLPTIAEFIDYGRINPGPMSVVFSSYLGWLRDRGLAPSTINGKRVVCRRFAEWAARVGYIDQQELLKIRDVKSIHSSGSKRGNWLEASQLESLLNAPDRDTLIGRRDRAILALLVGTGMRRSEIVNVTWGQLVQSGKTWIFENLDRKHGRTQEVLPIPNWAKNILDQYSEPKGNNDKIFVSYDRHGNSRKSMTDQAVYNIVKTYAAKSGFPKIAVHDLRRSFARLAASGGAPLSQLKEMMGHSSESVTEKYVNAIFDYEKAAEFVMLDVK